MLWILVLSALITWKKTPSAKARFRSNLLSKAHLSILYSDRKVFWNVFLFFPLLRLFLSRRSICWVIERYLRRDAIGFQNWGVFQHQISKQIPDYLARYPKRIASRFCWFPWVLHEEDSLLRLVWFFWSVSVTEAKGISDINLRISRSNWLKWLF